jgi:glutamine amidotransferase
MIAIVDYGAGNLTSVMLAFETLGISAHITGNAAEIGRAERILFPGVGAAGASMRNIQSLGIDDAIRQVVADGKPFLGICIGAQVSLDTSEEDGGTTCIGLVPGTVKRFRPSNPLDKVPQMGWNAVKQTASHPIFDGIQDESEFYFVHSYYPAPANSSTILGETSYADVQFTSVYGRDNLVATQFHPEKSGKVGLQLLKNFCNWTP